MKYVNWRLTLERRCHILIKNWLDVNHGVKRCKHGFMSMDISSLKGMEKCYLFPPDLTPINEFYNTL